MTPLLLVYHECPIILANVCFQRQSNWRVFLFQACGEMYLLSCQNGTTALMMAVWRRNTDFIELLLKAGANVHIRCNVSVPSSSSSSSLL